MQITWESINREHLSNIGAMHGKPGSYSGQGEMNYDYYYSEGYAKHNIIISFLVKALIIMLSIDGKCQIKVQLIATCQRFTFCCTFVLMIKKACFVAELVSFLVDC